MRGKVSSTYRLKEKSYKKRFLWRREDFHLAHFSAMNLRFSVHFQSMPLNNLFLVSMNTGKLRLTAVHNPLSVLIDKSLLISGGRDMRTANKSECCSVVNNYFCYGHIKNLSFI